jgi:hypothetical protein
MWLCVRHDKIVLKYFEDIRKINGSVKIGSLRQTLRVGRSIVFFNGAP